MKKLLTIFIFPLLLALPFSESCLLYFNGQTCQIIPKIEKDSCCCVSMQNQMSDSQDISCCCATAPQEIAKMPLLLESRIVEINLITDFEFTKPFDLTIKLNIIDDYSAYLSAGISSSEKFVLYSPPIYQQYCSLRI